MASDAVPVEVWVEWRQRPRAAVVVPYARARDAALVDYSVFVRRQGASGSTEIQQKGDLALQPNLPKPLGELLIAREPGDQCSVSVRVATQGDEKPVERTFPCPLVR